MNPKVSVAEIRKPSNPKLKWICYWPSPIPGEPRKRRRFPTREKAQDFAILKRAEIHNGGVATAGLKDEAVREAIWAAASLAPLGATLRDVVQDYIERRKAGDRSTTIRDAVDEILEAKKRDGLSDRYLSDLRGRLNRFADAFGKRLISDLAPAEIDAWLRDLPVAAVSRNNFRRVLIVFFSWASTMGYSKGNAAAESSKAKVVSGRVEVFTPEELRVLLDNAPADLLPFLAIGAFAGLRSSELERLDWSAVDLLKGRIAVGAAESKTASYRYVPISETLRAWLAPVARASGSICGATGTFRRKLRLWRRAMETGTDARPAVQWKDNGLRHSFASYALAREEDAARVAIWCGHDVKILLAHYRERVGAEEAESYFGVLPAEDKAKVVPYKTRTA